MTHKLEQAIFALRDLPQERQDELAEALIGAAMPVIDYSSLELETAIDEGMADIDAGRTATPDQVEAVLSRFR